METLLVAGTDSVAGANFAATLSDRFHVVGLSFSDPVSIAGCRSVSCCSDSVDAIRELLTTVDAKHIVLCGAAARSSWMAASDPVDVQRETAIAAAFATACAEQQRQLTLISSDAVFSGPWMFHDETSDSLNESTAGVAFRTIEDTVRSLCRDALVIRTNVFGWSPTGETTGFIESMLQQLEARSPITPDFLNHATPLLASKMARIVADAWSEELSGTFHVAGSVRTSPMLLVEQLADEFELPVPLSIWSAPSQSDTQQTIVETSLRTNRIRRELGIAMPTLGESVMELREQQDSGYRNRMIGQSPMLAGKVA